MVAVARGCGTRSPGGVYLVTCLGGEGVPLAECVVDPPIPVDATAVGLSPQGMALARTSAGNTRVLDWVGQESYPNTADYLEEVALFGSSRRVPRSFDFALLTPKSQHVLVHPRAIVANPDWVLNHRAVGFGVPRPPSSWLRRLMARAGAEYCPFNPDRHEQGAHRPETCAALWWEVLLPRTVGFSDDVGMFEAQCQRRQWVPRRMPAFGYEGYTLPDRDVWVPEFALGVFLALPITRIEVVADPEEGSHREALAKARRAHLPVIEVEE